jgi:hypothetical protein
VKFFTSFYFSDRNDFLFICSGCLSQAYWAVTTRQHAMTTEAQPTGGILAGYTTQEKFAADHLITTRTVARYRNQPDGLPSVEFGGKIYIPLAEASAWLSARISRPNPRRRSK